MTTAGIFIVAACVLFATAAYVRGAENRLRFLTLDAKPPCKELSGGTNVGPRNI